jgi:hypothetical protein
VGCPGTSTRRQFSFVLRRAEARHREALITFLNAERGRILGAT